MMINRRKTMTERSKTKALYIVTLIVITVVMAIVMREPEGYVDDPEDIELDTTYIYSNDSVTELAVTARH